MLQHTSGVFQPLLEKPHRHSIEPCPSCLDAICYHGISSNTYASIASGNGTAMHEDRGILTVIFADSTAGLQVSC